MDKIKEKKFRIVNELSNIEKPHPLETYKPYQKFIRSTTIKDHNYAYTTNIQNLLIAFILNPISRLKNLRQVFPEKEFRGFVTEGALNKLLFCLRGNFQTAVISLSTNTFNYLYRPLIFSYFNSSQPQEAKANYFWQLYLTLTCAGFVSGCMTYPFERWRTLVYSQTMPRALFGPSWFMEICLKEGVRGLWKGFQLRILTMSLQNAFFTFTFSNCRTSLNLSAELSVIVSVVLSGSLLYPLDTQLKKIQNEFYSISRKSKYLPNFKSVIGNLVRTPIRESFAGYSFYLSMNAFIFGLLVKNGINTKR